jgi:hypothetical protein
MSNTNKSSSWITQTLNIRTTTNFNTAAAAAVNSGAVTISRSGGNADRSSSSQVAVQPLLTVVLTAIAVPVPDVPIIPQPTITVQYAVFTTVGQTTWVAPATCISPIVYFVVGGAGGGGGCGAGRGSAGGGGGGQIVQDTFNIVPNGEYIALVGSGGTGGRGSSTGAISNPVNGTAYEENGRDGTSSVFNYDGAAPSPIARGGTGGYRAQLAPGGVNVGGAAAVGSSGGLGGNGGLTGTSGGGGGGGSSGSGANGTVSAGGAGGAGRVVSFPTVSSGANVTYGLGGAGGLYVSSSGVNGQAATENTGCGGGGGAADTGYAANGGKGANGIIIIMFSA